MANNPTPTPATGPADASCIAVRPVQAARLLNLSRAATYKLLLDGTIPSRKLGAARLILRSDLEAFARALPEA